MKRAILMIVTLLVIGAAASLGFSAPSRVWLTDQFDHLLIVRNQPGASFASIAAAAKPAVVNVITTHKVTLPQSLGLSPDAPGGPGEDDEDSPSVPGNSQGQEAIARSREKPSPWALRSTPMARSLPAAMPLTMPEGIGCGQHTESLLRQTCSIVQTAAHPDHAGAVAPASRHRLGPVSYEGL
jgi:hypothetical protein